MPARICVYNSAKSIDTDGIAINHSLASAIGSAKRSKPVRLFTMQGEIRYLGWEFIYTGNYGTDLSLQWYQEFYGDAPSLVAGSPPDKRVALGLDPDLTWARECDEEVGGAGAVTHTVVTRAMTMVADAGGKGTSHYLAMVLHAPWVRLAICSDGAPPASAQLAVYAHVGGHMEEAYLEANGDIPYAYNA